MSETNANTADKGQETGTQPEAKNQEISSAAGTNQTAPAEMEDTAETANRRQRFFSQTEVNRIVKREIDRALKNSKLPELEAAQAKVTELESRMRQHDIRSQVMEAAAKAGAKNTGLLFRAVEDKLEPDAEGKLKNLEEVLKKARQDYPELFRRDTSGNANGGAGQQNGPRLSMNELLRRGRD